MTPGSSSKYSWVLILMCLSASWLHAQCEDGPYCLLKNASTQICPDFCMLDTEAVIIQDVGFSDDIVTFDGNCLNFTIQDSPIYTSVQVIGCIDENCELISVAIIAASSCETMCDNGVNLGYPGTSCDDDNVNTIIDVFQEDCTCQGTLIEPTCDKPDIVNTCIYPDAVNYDPNAMSNIGVCILPVSNISICRTNDVQVGDVFCIDMAQFEDGATIENVYSPIAECSVSFIADSPNCFTYRPVPGSVKEDLTILICEPDGDCTEMTIAITLSSLPCDELPCEGQWIQEDPCASSDAISGCMNVNATNYDPEATCEDQSCLFDANNFDVCASNSHVTRICLNMEVSGYESDSYLKNVESLFNCNNFENPSPDFDHCWNFSAIPTLVGPVDVSMLICQNDFSTQQESCVEKVLVVEAINPYNNSCTSVACQPVNYNFNTCECNIDVNIVEGCTDPNFVNYDPAANCDNCTCETLLPTGIAESSETLEVLRVSYGLDGSCSISHRDALRIGSYHIYNIQGQLVASGITEKSEWNISTELTHGGQYIFHTEFGSTSFLNLQF